MPRSEAVVVSGRHIYTNSTTEVYECPSLPNGTYTRCSPEYCQSCRNAERQLGNANYSAPYLSGFKYYHPRSSATAQILVVPPEQFTRNLVGPTTTPIYANQPRPRSWSHGRHQSDSDDRSSRSRSMSRSSHVQHSDSHRYRDRPRDQSSSLSSLSLQSSSDSSDEDSGNCATYCRSGGHNHTDRHRHRYQYRSRSRSRSRSRDSTRHRYNTAYRSRSDSRDRQPSPVRSRSYSRPRRVVTRSPERSRSRTRLATRSAHEPRADRQGGPHSQCITDYTMSGGCHPGDRISESVRRDAGLRQDNFGVWHECNTSTADAGNASSSETRWHDGMDDGDFQEYLRYLREQSRPHLGTYPVRRRGFEEELGSSRS